MVQHTVTQRHEQTAERLRAGTRLVLDSGEDG